VDFNLNGNPDFSLSPTSNWTCTPPPPAPDTGFLGPERAQSRISCFDANDPLPTFLEAGGSLLLAIVRYEVPAGAPSGDVKLDLHSVAIVDPLAFEIGACESSGEAPPIDCGDAIVRLNGSAGGPIATTTPVPTNTAIPTATRPPVTPTRVRTTPTAPARTPTAAVTRTPSPKRRCADVDGDGRVRLRDVRRIAEAAARRTYDERYDINGDGRLSARDVAAATRQLGRRC
jgi:hypothetical protein